MVYLLIQIVQKSNGGEGLVFSQPATQKSLDAANYKTLRGKDKEEIPWGRLAVYIIQPMQGQSKAEDIVVCRRTLHSTSKVMRLNGESFRMSGSFSAMAAASAKCQE
jgi:hypothetical protein